MWTLRLIVGLFAAFAITLVAWHVATLPPQHRPFGQLNLEDPVGVFTQRRLAQLRATPEKCPALIAASKLEVSAVPDVEEGRFCRLSGAVSLERSVHAYSQPTRLSCPLAAALYVWERDVVDQAARKYLNAEVERIEVMGTYSCRRVYGRREGRVSNHATGDAIDVSGFRLADGRTISVLSDWSTRGAARDFLHAVRDGGCEVFQAVLSPDYNAAHRNHFHFDMGADALCE